jgi:WD40 repeat protein
MIEQFTLPRQADLGLLAVAGLVAPATGQERLTLKGHTQLVSGIAFSPDDKTLASGSWDGTVRA